MLDVHPPEHAPNSWRDFFIHIATIVIGLLLAIGLEQTVEALHHRHIVREARENIRQEIEGNRKQASDNIAAVQRNADNMGTNIEKARALRTNPHALEGNDMHFSFSWSSFNDSAWRSARDSGALTYMPTAEVQTYADNYNQQEIVNRKAVDIFTRETEDVAPLMMEKDPSEMHPEDIHALLHDCAVTSLQLTILKQLIQQLDKSYATTLSK